VPLALREDPPAVSLAPDRLDESTWGVYALTPAISYVIRRAAGGLEGQRNRPHVVTKDESMHGFVPRAASAASRSKPEDGPNSQTTDCDERVDAGIRAESDERSESLEA
jgi:hypothetical protein